MEGRFQELDSPHDIEREPATLPRMRLGSVSYLNAKPLIHGIETVVLEEPSALGRAFAEGGLDAALLPVFDSLQSCQAWIVDDVSISCRGRVYSVILAYRGKFSDIERVVLDPASRTSNQLARCLLTEFFEMAPAYVEMDDGRSSARVLIGDRAIQFRRQHPDWCVLDLGQAWWRFTGLPFVFACWRIRAGHPNPSAIAGALRRAKQSGVAARVRIAEDEPDPAFAYRYLTRFIHYDLRRDEKDGMLLFAELLRKHGLIDSAATPRLIYY